LAGSFISFETRLVKLGGGLSDPFPEKTGRLPSRPSLLLSALGSAFERRNKGIPR
jgi:hypothetical protein